MKILVEKRTLTFIVLATLIWALIATSSAAYYCLEAVRHQNELSEKQQLLSSIVGNYKASLEKRDLLLRDYNALVGEYYMFMDEDYFPLMDKYGKLLYNLGDNYTSTLNIFPNLQEAYTNLLGEFQELMKRKVIAHAVSYLGGPGRHYHWLQEPARDDVITREEFDSLLKEFSKLLTALAAKELESFIGEVTFIKVNLCIDYGNNTRTWYNVSASPGMTLFDLTIEVAEVEYDYYLAMEPGHVFVRTINGVAPSPSEGKYWFWYYLDDVQAGWVFGQVGCDAWTLRDNGTYRWIYKGWEP